MKKINKHMLALVCALAFLAGGINAAYADKTNVPKIGENKTVTGVNLMLGKAEMVTIGGEVADVLVANPSIVDVKAVKSDRLYLVGSSLGDTNIMALDADGNVLKKINVHVQIDTDKLHSLIRELYPNENVKVKAISDQIVLSGEVSTPAEANKITSLVGKFASDSNGGDMNQIDNMIVNMLNVRGEQQVMLRVKIVEASRSAVKNLGLNLQSLGGAGIGGVTGSLTANGGIGLSAPQQLATAIVNYASGDLGNLGLTMQALEQEGIVNTLAEPNLTAISGEQAGFLAGGEFPIPTQLDRNGNLVYEFKPFGVSLNFRPMVMSENRISLQLTTEVSTTSFEQNLQLNGVNVPTFNVRRAETNVELASGSTLMIAGLIQSDSISGLTQLPGIGDVPVVGDLVKSDSFQRSESEVLVMVTPYLVKPFAQNYAVTTPVPTLPTPVATIAPDVNYGALLPNDTDLPRLPPEGDAYLLPDSQIPKVPMPAYSAPVVRQENKSTSFFSSNIKRLYGKNAPEELLSEQKSYGYVLN